MPLTSGVRERRFLAGEVNFFGKSADFLDVSGRRKMSGFECFFCHKDMEVPEGTRAIPAITPEGRVLHLIRYCCVECQSKLEKTG